MILTCPNCATQYVVKDGSIPPEGRQVRCAACKHSWHQDPENSATQQLEAAPAPASTAEPGIPDNAPPFGDIQGAGKIDGDESLAEAMIIVPRSGPEVEERAYEEAMIDAGVDPAGAGPTAEAVAQSPSVENTAAAQEWPPTQEVDSAPDTFSPFAGDDEPAKRGSRTMIIAVLLIIVLAAAFWLLAPAPLKSRLGLAASATSPLTLVTTHTDRRPLESGNELLTVTGRVINPTAQDQDVPPLQAQLRSKTGKVLYSWTIQPPTRTLAAGASASFNSAELNVPAGGDEVTITLGQNAAGA